MLQPGDVLLNGQYRILRKIGRGGFGYVYHAEDIHLGEQVAIKELIPGLVGDEIAFKRFLAEARTTIRLRHVRIVGTHHVFPEAGNSYIVMEYMAGGSLEDRLRQQGLWQPGEAAQVAADVCEGLAYAHKEGIVHCDLKPANVLFDAAGRAKVADFGIAHISGEMLTRSWHTPAGFVAGTLPYMSPEQTDGVRDDPRLDLYALGAVLYRMLTGRTYLDFDMQETPRAQAQNVARICDERPWPPSRYNHEVPAWLDAVVLRALAKRPEERYANADAMRAALVGHERPRAATAPSALMPSPPHHIGSTTPVAGTKPGSEKRSYLPRWFWPALVAAGLLFVALVVAVGAVLRNADTTPTAAETSQAAATLAFETFQAGETTTRLKDGMVMVYVPGADFVMGTETRADNTEPAASVTLDGFWIDQTEVTNDQYQECLAAGACPVPQYADDPEFDGSTQPVVGVSWDDAETYCRWVEARLPTEAEWEMAARGNDAVRSYPWGDEAPDCSRLNYRHYYGKTNYELCVGRTSEVGSYPNGASVYGVMDMSGNAWEWVNAWYDARVGSSTPESAAGARRVLRGGGWNSTWSFVQPAFRYGSDPTIRTAAIGFRCARSTGE